MIVYTFWEPREKVPYYLQLCMETWKKFLPNTEVVVLDYKNIGEYIDIDKDIGSNLRSGQISLQVISDAIRIAVLLKYGGVWLDFDTIILNSNVEKYFLPDEDNKVVFFGRRKDESYAKNFCQMCFINTRPNSKLINVWLDYIREKLSKLPPSEPRAKWSFFGNSFINKYSLEHPEEVKLINNRIAMPHKNLMLPHEKTGKRAYYEYYFYENYHLEDISNDMLFLQNSWTPRYFKKLAPKDFLSYDCTLTNVLAEALEIKLPPSQSRSRIKPKTEQ